MKCPACTSANLSTTDRCEKCGYVFVGEQKDSIPVLASIDRSLKSIRTILAWWFVLTLTGAALWIVIGFLQSASR
jgi:hypothetical protein